MIVKSDVVKSLEAGTLKEAVAVAKPGTCHVSIALARFEKAYHEERKNADVESDNFKDLTTLLVLLKGVHLYQSSASKLEKVKKLARSLREHTSSSDIVKSATKEILEGLDLFDLDYYAHTSAHSCVCDKNMKSPCKAECPAHVNASAYIGLASEGDFDGAVKMVRKDNPFVTACALVCEHPCENHCRRKGIDDAVNIRLVKKLAVDNCHADVVSTPARGKETGKKVAIIGAGPCGLTCAYYLAILGHNVDVYESRAKMGGMLRYGIPRYRFPRERLDEDINAILGVGGINVELNCDVDDAKFNEIKNSHDATFVAIGAHTGKGLRIENADAKGVMSAVEILRAIGDDEYPDFTGKKVGVVGGGNVAMDCCRSSVRCNADEVYVFYRRRQEDMPANAVEIEGAIEEGVKVLSLQAPVGLKVDAEGNLTAMRTQPQKVIPVPGGRPKPEPDTDKGEVETPIDILLLAVGQDIVCKPFEDAGMKTEWKAFKANEFLEAEDMPGVWVGGDCQTSPASAIMAIGAGKVAAYNIDFALTGEDHTVDPGVEAKESYHRYLEAAPREEVHERDAEARIHDFEYIELDVDPHTGMRECGRCMHCDLCGWGSEFCVPLGDGEVYATDVLTEEQL